MVLATLREIENPGTGKTQTRRVLNPQPDRDCHHFHKVFAEPPYFEARNRNNEPIYPFHYPKDCVSPYPRISIAVGDLLYVREAWRTYNSLNEYSPLELLEARGFKEKDGSWPIFYIADGETKAHTGKFRQGMHLPRALSRITLKVTDVRVQRVQDISIDDMTAEGIDLELEPYSDQFCQAEGIQAGGGSCGCRHAELYPFKLLWNSLNEKRGYGWETNPWVAAYTFEPMLVNVDQLEAA